MWKSLLELVSPMLNAPQCKPGVIPEVVDGSVEDQIDMTLLKNRAARAPLNPEPAPPHAPELPPEPTIADIDFKNSSDRLMREFEQLGTKNPELQVLLLELDQHLEKTYGNGVILTMIYRTEAEQDYLYRNNKRYRKKKFRSPHQFWHAADLRTWAFSKEEIAEIVDWLNEKYNATNGKAWTAKAHDIGSGFHFHVQYFKKA